MAEIRAIPGYATLAIIQHQTIISFINLTEILINKSQLPRIMRTAHINDIVESQEEELSLFMLEHDISLTVMKRIALALTKTVLNMNECRVSSRPRDFRLLLDYGLVTSTAFPDYVKVTDKGYDFYQTYISKELKPIVS